MLPILKFYWLCLKEAARGSVDIANAWQGVWGIIALWAFGYWRGGPVMIPDKFDEYALIILFTSLVATWVGVFIFQFLTAPANLYRAQRERADDLRAELSIAKKEPDAATKWTITELFQHIDPDFFENKRWEAVGDELRDALSEGRLIMWGRLKETDSGPWVGPRAALTPIEKTYWYKAFFTYSFFYDDAAKSVLCYADRKTGRPGYTDLQVKRGEALAIWRGEPEEVAENYANVRVADNPSIHDEILRGEDRQKFLGLLNAGVLAAWGRPMLGRTDFVPIPKASWETHFIDVRLNFGHSDVDGKRIYSHQTFLKVKNTNDPVFYDICVNRAQMNKVWKDKRFVRDDGSGV